MWHVLILTQFKPQNNNVERTVVYTQSTYPIPLPMFGQDTKVMAERSLFIYIVVFIKWYKYKHAFNYRYVLMHRNNIAIYNRPFNERVQVNMHAHLCICTFFLSEHDAILQSHLNTFMQVNVTNLLLHYSNLTNTGYVTYPAPPLLEPVWCWLCDQTCSSTDRTCLILAMWLNLLLHCSNLSDTGYVT